MTQKILPACLILALSAVGAFAEVTIVVHEPDVWEGAAIEHDASTLRIRGEVTTEGEVQEVTLNGRAAALGARDLVVEELGEEGAPFQGALVLAAGDNRVEIVARTSDGQSGKLRFSVRVDASSLGGTAYALVVGINDYKDARISDLRYAEPDARAVVEALTHPQYGIVKAENVKMLLSAEATYRNVSMALEEQLVRQATKPEDVVFFYFAGHGAEGPHVSRGAAYYLVPHDADLRNLLSTAIDKGRLQFLWGAMGAARKVFITDACHSGGLQDMKILSATGLETVEGFITLAAARADQRSWELPRLGHGIFTYSLTEGLKGAADREGGNGDGFVSAEELGNYLQGQVGKLAAEVGADQTPVVDLVPGAGGVLIGTSNGQFLPPWQAQAAPAVLSAGGAIKVTMRFRESEKNPKVVLAIRDEGGDANLGKLVEVAIINRFLEVSEAFRFVEPGAIAAALDQEQVALAYSENPGDLAAVARAVAADLLLTGQAKSETSGKAAEELLGTAVTSFQAYLSTRVVYANSGEIIQALNVQKPGMHLNPEMARRQALEKAGVELADQLMGPMIERWSELRRARPNGSMTVENVGDLDVMEALEEALLSLEPAVQNLNWRSYAEGKALYEFDTKAKPKAVADRLENQGLPGFKVARIKARKTRLTFLVKR